MEGEGCVKACKLIMYSTYCNIKHYGNSQERMTPPPF